MTGATLLDDHEMMEAPRIDADVGWRAVKFLPDESGSVRVAIEKNESLGYFRYALECYFGPAEEDEGQWPDGFWQYESLSGLYALAAEAERDARASVSLRLVEG